jgi:hypothetical protein
MMEHSFELIPFPDPGIPKIKITGSTAREGNILRIRYALSGTMEEILFPTLNPQPGRKDGLWQRTCFEFFLAFPDQPRYWEFNLSPSGDWNIYRMDAYRQVSFQQEDLIRSLRLDSRRSVDCYHLETLVNIGPILIPEKPLLMGISSVIQTLDGHETYWSLIHPGSQADFHQRESFILALEG